MALMLMCLAVVTLMVGSVGRLNHGGRQQVFVEEHAAQTGWLVESGVRRALAKINKDESYEGEVWILSSNELWDSRSGTVRIDVAEKTDSDQAVITVAAELSIRGQTVSKQTKRFNWKRPSQ